MNATRFLLAGDVMPERLNRASRFLIGNVKFVEDGLAAYNLQYTPYNTQRLVVLLRAADGKLHFLQKDLSPS
jgi:hypothetical protein